MENNEFAPDFITLIDEEGTEHDFEILDVIENDKGIFYALFPVFDTPEEQLESSGEYYIFEVVEDNGDEVLTEVEDEDLLDALAEEFESRFNETLDEAEGYENRTNEDLDETEE